MTKEKFNKLIREVINEILVKEEQSDFSQLCDGISTITEIGKHWHKLISALESVVNETKDFKELYRSSLHGPTPSTIGAMRNLQQILNLLKETKPVIIGMHEIQKQELIR
jgi:hypothetical protein